MELNPEIYDPAHEHPGVHLYLEEFQKADAAVRDAELRAEKARFEFEMELKRYAMVRDVLWDRFHLNPWRAEKGLDYELEWLGDREWDEGSSESLPTGGRFRFVHMAPGDAVLAALQESEEPMTFGELLERLREGGMQISDGRVINAALRNTAEVRRKADGRYYSVDPRRKRAAIGKMRNQSPTFEVLEEGDSQEEK